MLNYCEGNYGYYGYISDVRWRADSLWIITLILTSVLGLRSVNMNWINLFRYYGYRGLSWYCGNISGGGWKNYLCCMIISFQIQALYLLFLNMRWKCMLNYSESKCGYYGYLSDGR